MGLNGIDVSSWQAGIDIPNVDADFVIVKATGGVGYVNPNFKEMADATLASGKLLGIYHFAGDDFPGSANSEAKCFLEAVKPYLGKFIPVLDWEADAVNWSMSWAREWLDIVAAETGATPWFYSYLSFVQSHQAQCGDVCMYPLWLAAYYNGYQAMNYVENPPLYGSTIPWNKMTCYQYSSTGYVSGYGARLDINRFYGTREDWLAMCGQEEDMSITHEEMEQIAELCAARVAESAYWPEDKKEQWGPEGKGTGKYMRNSYNVMRLVHDLLIKVKAEVAQAKAAAEAAKAAATAAKSAAEKAAAGGVDPKKLAKETADELAARMKE